MSNLRYSYDSESDCGYIRLGDGAVTRTESLTASLHVDRDGHDNIVGIEVLTVTDPSWIPHVTNLLTGRVPDATLVPARFQDMVATHRHEVETTVSPKTADTLTEGPTGDAQVA